MRPLIIINKTAAKAQQAWPIIEPQLIQKGFEFEIYYTGAPGDATIRTREALKSGTPVIAVIGGDGTLSEAAAGFFEFNADPVNDPDLIQPNATLVILPAGTGDDFARGLHGSRVPLQQSIDSFVSYLSNDGTARLHQVDVLYGLCNAFTNPFICLNASTMGIGGETAQRVLNQGQLMRKLSGEFRFVAAAIGALTVWRERRVRVTVDGRLMADDRMNLVGVANALYAGGGMMLSPSASVTDGHLDVITATRLSRTAVVRELSRIHSGGHVKNPKVQCEQGKIVRIETFSAADAMPIEADGNVRGFTPVQYKVLPGALNFLSPTTE